MNKPNYIRYLGMVESKKYLQFIEENQITFDVNNDYGRERYFNACKTFFLVENSKINNLKLLESFFEISNDLNQILNSKFGDGSIYNIQFSLLPPKYEIKKHYDDGLYFTLSNRVHLPLITNEDVIFSVGDQKFNLKVDRLVEINNKKIHSVSNKSNHSRIHLILDYLPIKYSRYL